MNRWSHRWLLQTGANDSRKKSLRGTMKKKKKVGLFIALPTCWFFAVGCNMTQLSKPVPLNEALAIVENDLRASAPVALSDLGGVRKDKISQGIFTAQCASRRTDPQTGAVIPGSGTPNPLIPVITGPVSIALQGSIQRAGAFTGTASPTTPSLAGSYTLTQSKQQQLTVPITFVSARGLPNFYMGQNLTNLTNLDKGADKDRLVGEILANQRALAKLVEEAMAAYPANESSCPKDLTSIATPPFAAQAPE
jgi:hypothetical protein